jgi:hypothetical protein
MKNAEISQGAERLPLSRRIFIGRFSATAVAATVGAALPAMGLSGCEAVAFDASGSMVSAAIDAHKRAFSALQEADAQLNDFVQALPDEVTRQARVQVGGGWFDGKEYEPIWAYCPADIDHVTASIAVLQGPEKMAEERARLHAGFWSDVDTVHELRRSSGLSKMQDLVDAAEDKESEALDDLLSVDLHSLDESRALAGYLRDYLEATHSLQSWSLLNRCFVALARGQRIESAERV